MPAPLYQAGFNGKVFANGVELSATKYSLTDKANAKDVSNTKDGRKRIATLPDAEASVDLHWDANLQPTDNPPNLRRGTILTFQFYVSPGKYFSWNGLIDEVTISSEIEGTVDYSVKVVMESGVNGVTYP
jgi:hypothetical protein